MSKSFSFASPILRRAVAASVCLALLCVASGCSSASRPSFRRSSHSHPLSYNVPSAVETEIQPGIADQEDSPATELRAPDSDSTLPLTEDNVIALFRKSGGKLRPNDAGDIVEIDLSFSDITDSLLPQIVVFSELAELDLTGTEIHDASLASLPELRNLRAVKVKGTKITSEGLRQLSQIPTLILLDASNTAVSDDGLIDARQWTSLRYLSMNHTAVSDAGLRHLESLRDLKGLSVINTAVTEEGVLNLRQVLPDCLIVAQSERKQTRVESSDSVPRLPDTVPSNSTIVGIASQQQLAHVVYLAAQQPHLAVHLSQIYSSCEMWPEAAQVLATASAASPDDAAIHTALGEALARSGHLEEALSHFQQSVDEGEAKYLVGMIAYESTLRTCERYFDDVVRSDPTLNAAHLRRDKIQQELASLKLRQHSRVKTSTSNNVPEIVPAPLIRTATQSRHLQTR